MSTTDVAAEALDPSDPYARAAQTFPVLDDEMAERLAAFGQQQAAPKGTMLFERGQRSVDFFFVVEGSVEIFEGEDAGPANIIHVHRAGQFTGELDLFNDRQILVSARAGDDSRVVRIRRADFRRLIAAEPDVGEIIMRAFILRRLGLMQHHQGGVVLVGPGHGGDTIRLQRFLTRNGYPYRMIDTDADPGGEGFLDCFHLSSQELPVVIAEHEALRNPSNLALADRLGISIEIDTDHVHDLAVVGAGPAGLAAAVYAASEGLDTLILEGAAPGGQAGTSSKIENYLGFPTGISGQALAGRAQVQAQKFGARLAVSRSVVALDCDVAPYRLKLEDGRQVRARAVVVATGARYRKLDIPGYERFEGQGIHYAATALEAQLCAREPVVIVGGGNSAGQAAVFLSRTVGHVHIIVRGPGLAATMSSYLIDRIEASPRITLHPHTELVALEGDHALREVTWRSRKTDERVTKRIGNVFVMIGAEPNTEWLDGCLELDDRGFVSTGADGSAYATSRPGVFAVGDVRSGSVKRVASGVGEGSVVVQAIHRYLDPQAH